MTRSLHFASERARVYSLSKIFWNKVELSDNYNSVLFRSIVKARFFVIPTIGNNTGGR